MITLKITENLHVVGNNVISYDTKVAVIEGNTLVELGKWSRTTSKHICRVASLFRLSVIPAKDKKWPSYGWLEYGVKSRRENSVGPDTSAKLAEVISSGVDFKDSIYFVDLNCISKRDRLIIENEMQTRGITQEQIESLKNWYSIKNLV